MESPFSSHMGRILIGLGMVLILIGLVFLYKDEWPFLKQLGQLPGDIAVKRENFRFYFPLTTSILLSVVLSFLFWLMNRFGK